MSCLNILTSNNIIFNFILGGCPYYNSYQGNMDERKCDPRYGSCSRGLYKSPSSLRCKYPT